ncbi:MAG: DOMON-like domain-containing protein [Betaproteobacteria bacterium]|nr:DOMON-like domain-containing protein [Betaproteobacteria bacterium]
MIDCGAIRSAVSEVTLVRHPESLGGAVRSAGASVCRRVGGTLAITYSIEADLARVRVPPPRSPCVVHGLWQHTCCECFIALDGQPGYHEFDFAPSGAWVAYAFAKYREGAPLADEGLNPRVAVRRAAERIEVDASIPLERLSDMHRRGRLALALSVVVEHEDGVLSYWALKHPAGKPDFHHRDSFVLELEGL